MISKLISARAYEISARVAPLDLQQMTMKSTKVQKPSAVAIYAMNFDRRSAVPSAGGAVSVYRVREAIW